tara:strand:+ start:86 stop:292 length:207 start_codon:yes stop_codon:yes gene_type:complete
MQTRIEKQQTVALTIANIDLQTVAHFPAWLPIVVNKLSGVKVNGSTSAVSSNSYAACGLFRFPVIVLA